MHGWCKENWARLTDALSRMWSPVSVDVLAHHSAQDASQHATLSSGTVAAMPGVRAPHTAVSISRICLVAGGRVRTCAVVRRMDLVAPNFADAFDWRLLSMDSLVLEAAVARRPHSGWCGAR